RRRLGSPGREGPAPPCPPQRPDPSLWPPAPRRRPPRSIVRAWLISSWPNQRRPSERQSGLAWIGAGRPDPLPKDSDTSNSLLLSPEIGGRQQVFRGFCV